MPEAKEVFDQTERYYDQEESTRQEQEEHQSRIWTSMPITIGENQPDKNTCTVDPTLKLAYLNNQGKVEWKQIPTIKSAPLLALGGGGMAMTIPVQKGDEGLAIFASRGVDNWWANGGIQNQDHSRMHSLSDAFIIPGFRSQPRKLKNVSTKTFQLRTDKPAGPPTTRDGDDGGGSMFEFDPGQPATTTRAAVLPSLTMTIQSAIRINSFAGGILHAAGVSLPPIPSIGQMIHTAINDITHNSQLGNILHTAAQKIGLNVGLTRDIEERDSKFAAGVSINLNSPIVQASANIKAYGSIDASLGFFKNGIPISGGAGGAGGPGGAAGSPPPLPTDPNPPNPGDIWWDAVGGQLYIFYTDPSGPPGQWVAATNQAAGPPGPQGGVGPQGPQGSTGAQGTAGLAGPQGPAGAQGPQGVIGPQGYSGVPGEQGPQGVAGPIGPASIIPGPQGEQGLQGPQGVQGETGATGPQGPQGIQGIPGTSGSSTTVGDTAPPSPSAGSGWWDSTDGQLYIWYDDPSADTGQWVSATNQTGSFAGTTAGGDLGGAYPNPTVTATHLAAPLPIAQGGTGVTTAAAGGDLGATYPNPTVTATHLAAPLPVLQGGTGSTTVAGSPFLPLVGGLLTGDLQIARSTSAYLYLDRPNNSVAGITFRTSGNNRWIISGANASAETGSGNIGSNFDITRWSDAGAYIDTPLVIMRNTGMVGIPNGIDGDLLIARTTSADGYIIRPNVAGYKNLRFAVAGAGPLDLLDLNATTIYARGTLNVTSGGIIVTAPSGISGGNGYTCRFGAAGAYSGNAFNISWSDRHLWIDNVDQGQISITSDYRIKSDIAPLPSTWAHVKALRPISYSIKGSEELLIAPDEREHWGFIAHELQDTLIESAASGYKDAPNQVQSPDVMTLLATVTKALQEAMDRIEALEARP